MAVGLSEKECLGIVEEVRRGREKEVKFIAPSKISLLSSSGSRGKDKGRERGGERGASISHSDNNNNNNSPVLLGSGGFCNIYEATLLGWEDQEEGKREKAAQTVINQEKGKIQPVIKDFNQIVDVPVALRVVQSDKKNEVLKEFKHVVSIHGTTVNCYGLSILPTSQLGLGKEAVAKGGEKNAAYLWKPEKSKPVKERFCVCMLMELCHGNMDEFVKKYNDRIPISTRVDIMLRALNGLMILKHKGVVWRDLKGQNMLVKKFQLQKEDEEEKEERVPRERRNSTTETTTTAAGLSLLNKQQQTISEVDFVLSDWGTSCVVAKDPNRRMTLNGPGTDGYIAPETKSAQYSYQVDMFAFLVWAASLCVDTSIAGLGDGELEYQIAKLKLNVNFSRSKAAEEMKVQKVLSRFKSENLVREDCLALYDTLLNGCTWTQPELRWTCEEAYIKMERFKIEQANNSTGDTAMAEASPINLSAADGNGKENSVLALAPGKDSKAKVKAAPVAKKKSPVRVLRIRNLAPARKPFQAVNVN
jgi:serine/threonine protein kinase